MASLIVKLKRQDGGRNCFTSLAAIDACSRRHDGYTLLKVRHHHDMKSCSYCGRESTDDAVCCWECGTTEFKDTAVTEDLATVSDDGETESYEKITDLPVADAQMFLAELESADIHFRLIPLDSEMKEMDAFTASVGGAFGRASSVRIFTRHDDDAKVEKIWRAFCGFDD